MIDEEGNINSSSAVKDSTSGPKGRPFAPNLAQRWHQEAFPLRALGYCSFGLLATIYGRSLYSNHDLSPQMEKE